MKMKAQEVLNLKKFDHISMAVKDARKTAEAYEKMLGIGPWAFHEFGGKTRILVAYAYLQNGVEFELIQVIKGRIFHSEFMDKHGEGLHHIGFAVDYQNVLEYTKKLVEHGAKVVLDLDPGCQYVKFDDDGGAIIELYGKHPPYLESWSKPE